MKKNQYALSGLSLALTAAMTLGTCLPYLGPIEIKAAAREFIAEKTDKGYHLRNEYFDVETGRYGEITSLKIVGDEYDTNYVMNVNDNPKQDTPAHEWMGDLMFKTKKSGEENWTEALTNSSDAGRSVELKDNKIVVTYDNTKTEGERAIRDFRLVETYSLADDQLRWEITVENTTDSDLIFGDFGVPLAFHEIWVNQGEAYETCTVDHSFVGKDSSYVYATRPSGEGHFLLMTPDTETGAGFEYQDHWQVGQRRAEEKEWCMDQADWANGLNVFYIHADAVSADEKSGNKGYMDSTSMTLEAGKSKTYAFEFTGVADEKEMKDTLYEEGIMDAVAVPGMTFARDMPAKMYLHTKVPSEDISFEFRCPHTNNLHRGTNTVSNNLPCEKTEDNTYAEFTETKVIDGEQYHIYNIAFGDLGQNDIIVNYRQNGKEKTTMLQFYMMDDLQSALNLHSDFLLKTQWDAPGAIQDKVFDDWMMDSKSKRGSFDGYWGWGDDWGYVHGEYLAEMNSYNPVEEQVQALDEYLDTAIWENLMQEHQEDFLIHDFLMPEPNGTPTYRGFAYPHIYNTYFSMYKIAEQYPDLIEYKEDADTYLLRCYHIMDALYNEGSVGYNWNTGLMGESTTPSIIQALKERGYEEEAENLESVMEKKFNNFANDKYPYISEYPYDNTSEEAVYTMAKMFGNEEVMAKVNEKTRACRGVQPIWYHYGNPTTICGENWFNFQYTASLAGYCMDDWLRRQDNGMSSEEAGLAQRINYAGKLANFTVINSGQIDADAENVGTAAWTYQAEMGNDTALGTGGGKLHNGWRQMSGEADLALFGAIRIASSDVAEDPVFGLLGYGCEVSDNGSSYEVTPLDGVYHRLNLINEQVSLELYRDQYSSAVVSKDGSSISLDIVNVTGQEHESNLDITGIPAGTYQVFVNGQTAGSFEAQDQTTTVALPIPEGDSAGIRIQPGELLNDTTPVVDAGEDTRVTMEEETVLHGMARDAAWLHRTPDVTWTAEEAPAGAKVTFANDKAVSTKVEFDKAGEYTLKLTAEGRSDTASDTVKITVEGIPQLPETIASYDFEEANVDTENKTVKDISGSGINAELKANVEFSEGKDGRGVSMDGEIGGYVKLKSGLTKYTKEATISMDIKLNGKQTNGTRLFEFGDMDDNLFYAACESANELSLNITNQKTKEVITAKSGVLLNPDAWQNIEVTLKDNRAVLYINGEAYAEIEDAEFDFSRLGTTQRSFLGRSYSESTPWLNGTYDNFKMLSKAMSAEEIKAAYGSDEAVTVTEVVVSPVITSVGVAPEMPKTAKVEYSNGLCQYEQVTWNEIDKSSYAKKGEFEVSGRIDALELEISTMVQVVEGKEQNIALLAVPTAVFDNPDDLGGVAGLNDGFDPANSNDKSHGVWHNWQGDQKGEAWVQYTWNAEVTITGTDAYYFTDGNFAPASVNFQYLDREGNWRDVENGDGFDTKLNQYNKTVFSPVTTTAFRMIMNPKTLGCGVIEWKVYGYSDESAADKKLLQAALDKAKALNLHIFEEGAEEILNTAIAEAQAVFDNTEASQDEVDAAAARLERVMITLPVMDANLAYSATPSTSFISDWEKLSAVNDAVVPESSQDPDPSLYARYGTWGNESEYETVTYTWDTDVTLNESDIYFWYDGSTTTNGGINIPESYKYEYLDKEGNWNEVTEPTAYATEIDGFNTTSFEPVTTKAFRVTMVKQDEDKNGKNGVGLMEWKVYGTIAKADKTALTEAVEEASGIETEIYTQETKTAFEKALADAKAILADPDVSSEEVKLALSRLVKAQNNLEEKGGEGIRNLALGAKTDGLCNYDGLDGRLSDLGGLAALNDGAVPENSADQSSPVWHNWHDRYGSENQVLNGWVSYTWDEPVVLDSTNVYYFRNGSGDFLPKAVQFEYLDEEGIWNAVTGAEGLGCEADRFNTTTFDRITTTAIRMNMEPALREENQEDPSRGTGVLEWQVMGIYAKELPNKDTLRKAVEAAEEKQETDYTEDSWKIFDRALKNAKEVLNDIYTDQEQVDNALDSLMEAMENLTEAGTESGVRNMAACAAAEGLCSYDGQDGRPYDLGGLAALNDGAVPENSADTANGAWHNWLDRYDENGSIQDGWVSYTWEKPVVLEGSSVYFFQNGNGDFLPASAQIEYLSEEGTWLPVSENRMGCDADTFNTITFDKITTTSIRMIMKPALREGSEEDPSRGTGVLEWQAMGQYADEIKENADKTLLKEALAEAAGKQQADYTGASWEAFRKAYEKAKDIYADTDADQTLVNAVLAELNDAISGLTEKADLTELNSMIARAEKKTEDAYTEETWNLFAEALTAAKAAAEKEDITQEEADNARDALRSAMENLEKKDADVVNKEALKAAIEEAEKKEESKYTKESWEGFARAWKAAKEVFENEAATAEQVEEQTALLNAAMAALVLREKDPEDPEQEADKAALAKLVEKANGFTRADYTEDTWAVFDLALVNAQKVLADKAADQETVDKAGKELQAAMNQLVKVNNESSLDLSRIKALIQKAEKLEKEDYTAASFQTFSQALKEAKAILDADGASQSDVDKKAQALEKAMKNLKKKSGSGPKAPGNTGGKGSSGKGSGSGSGNGAKSVKTGDETPILPFAGVAVLSLAGIVCLLKRRRTE
ncbi:DUF5695 domain-containing protein [Blautia sp.]|uniref:DUF5695 domain-containing protein n=1 Tax=Blautia sp. TaxID=1955243 RepID=UPI003AB9074A